jgi:hypothetical protein
VIPLFEGASQAQTLRCRYNANGARAAGLALQVVDRHLSPQRAYLDRERGITVPPSPLAPPVMHSSRFSDTDGAAT